MMRFENVHSQNLVIPIFAENDFLIEHKLLTRIVFKKDKRRRIKKRRKYNKLG